RTRMVDQGNFAINYFYDANGRLARLTDTGGNTIVQYAYDAQGRLARQDRANTDYTLYDHDSLGRLTHVVNYAPNGSGQSRSDYTSNSRGLQATMASLDGTWTYEYDALDQLTHAVFTSTNPSISNQDLSYLYDAAGNRVRAVENSVTTDYQTNAVNQYTSV